MLVSGHANDAETVQILYRNYRGETNMRRVRPSRIWFGATAWHPEAQWLMDAVDLDKGAERSFALCDILRFGATAADVSR